MSKKGSTASEVEAIVAKYGLKQPPGSKCSIGTSPHRALIEELSRRGMSDDRISEVIRVEKGTRYSDSTLQRHRRRLCLCP